MPCYKKVILHINSKKKLSRKQCLTEKNQQHFQRRKKIFFFHGRKKFKNFFAKISLEFKKLIFLKNFKSLFWSSGQLIISSWMRKKGKERLIMSFLKFQVNWEKISPKIFHLTFPEEKDCRNYRFLWNQHFQLQTKDKNISSKIFIKKLFVMRVGIFSQRSLGQLEKPFSIQYFSFLTINSLLLFNSKVYRRIVLSYLYHIGDSKI